MRRPASHSGVSARISETTDVAVSPSRSPVVFRPCSESRSRPVLAERQAPRSVHTPLAVTRDGSVNHTYAGPRAGDGGTMINEPHAFRSRAVPTV